MKASIYKINPRNGYIAADPNSNGQYFTIIDSLNGEFMVGDVLEWERSHQLGPGTIYNHRSKRNVRVIFENHDVSQSMLSAQLRIDHE